MNKLTINILLLPCALFAQENPAISELYQRISEEQARVARGGSVASVRVEPTSGQVEEVVEYAYEEEDSTIDLTKPSAVPVKEVEDYELLQAEMDRLDLLDETQINLSKMPIDTAFQTLAMAAEMNFMTLPRREDFPQTITVRTYDTPYGAMVALAEAHGVGMDFRKSHLSAGGRTRPAWHFYKPNQEKIISRSYQIKYFSFEDYAASPSRVTLDFSSNDSSSSGGAGSAAGAGSSVKRSDTDGLVMMIKNYLKGRLASDHAFGGSAGDFGVLPEPDFDDSRISVADLPEPKVIYIPQTKMLRVDGSARQHKALAHLLDTIDRPQSNITYVVQIMDVSAENSDNIGIDWSGVASNRTIRTGSDGFSFEPFGALQGSDFRKTFILSTDQLSVTLNALNKSDDARLLIRNEVIGVPNKATVMTNTNAEPLLVSTGITSSGSSSTDQSEVAYLNFGEDISFLGEIFRGGMVGYEGACVKLTTAFSLSNQTGEKLLNGNAAPTAGAQTIATTLMVPNGHTLVMSGMMRDNDSDNQTALPLLGKIPLIKRAFSSAGTSTTKRKIMVFVTPFISGAEVAVPANIDRLTAKNTNSDV